MKKTIAAFVGVAVYAIALFGLTGLNASRTQATVWVNAQQTSVTNPFFGNGITVTTGGRSYEIGFREDGTVIWKYSK
jgi:hypothetical protein